MSDSVRLRGPRKAHANVVSRANGVDCRLSVEDGRIIFRVGDQELDLSPELADALSADFRTAAIEARNGGALG